MTESGLGLQIERKVDIIALTALFLSIFSVLTQIFFYFQGPVVQMVAPPTQVTFNRETHRDGENYLFIGAGPLNYTNTGRAGYNAVLFEEKVMFTLSGNHYEYLWYQIGFLTERETGDSYEFYVHEPEPTGAIVVSAQSGVSHETYFQPQPIYCAQENQCDRGKNFLQWDDFLEALRNVSTIEFEFVGRVLNEDDASQRCTVHVNQRLIDYLERYHWSSPFCFPYSET